MGIEGFATSIRFDIPGQVWKWVLISRSSLDALILHLSLEAFHITRRTTRTEGHSVNLGTVAHSLQMVLRVPHCGQVQEKLISEIAETTPAATGPSTRDELMVVAGFSRQKVKSLSDTNTPAVAVAAADKSALHQLSYPELSTTQRRRLPARYHITHRRRRLLLSERERAIGHPH